MIAQTIIKLCQAIQQAGGRALLVGGWVRDFVLGRETVDYDVEVYGVEAAQLRALLDRQGKVDAVGEAFTVYKVRLREAGKSFASVLKRPEGHITNRRLKPESTAKKWGKSFSPMFTGFAAIFANFGFSLNR